jgi:uncharacterized membrane protein required for colicin V production
MKKTLVALVIGLFLATGLAMPQAQASMISKLVHKAKQTVKKSQIKAKKTAKKSEKKAKKTAKKFKIKQRKPNKTIAR